MRVLVTVLVWALYGLVFIVSQTWKLCLILWVSMELYHLWGGWICFQGSRVLDCWLFYCCGRDSFQIGTWLLVGSPLRTLNFIMFTVASTNSVILLTYFFHSFWHGSFRHGMTQVGWHAVKSINQSIIYIYIYILLLNLNLKVFKGSVSYQVIGKWCI